MIYYVIDPNHFVLACPSNRSAGSNSGVNLKFYEKGWGIAMYKRSDTSTKRQESTYVHTKNRVVNDLSAPLFFIVF